MQVNGKLVCTITLPKGTDAAAAEAAALALPPVEHRLAGRKPRKVVVVPDRIVNVVA